MNSAVPSIKKHLQRKAGAKDFGRLSTAERILQTPIMMQDEGRFLVWTENLLPFGPWSLLDFPLSRHKNIQEVSEPCFPSPVFSIFSKSYL
jgi:hypothetical protein